MEQPCLFSGVNRFFIKQCSSDKTKTLVETAIYRVSFLPISLNPSVLSNILPRNISLVQQMARFPFVILACVNIHTIFQILLVILNC
jgi:antirestriction protein